MGVSRRVFIPVFAAFGHCVAVLWAGGPAGAGQAEIRLIMVEEVGCRFCAKWDKDVGGVYGASAEGAFAPLLRVKRAAPELAAFKPVVYTPTFILTQGGAEIGRITGYPGQSYFWEELGLLLAPAGFKSDRGPQKSGLADPGPGMVSTIVNSNGSGGMAPAGLRVN